MGLWPLDFWIPPYHDERNCYIFLAGSQLFQRSSRRPTALRPQNQWQAMASTFNRPHSIFIGGTIALCSPIGRTCWLCGVSVVIGTMLREGVIILIAHPTNTITGFINYTADLSLSTSHTMGGADTSVYLRLPRLSIGDWFHSWIIW